MRRDWRGAPQPDATTRVDEWKRSLELAYLLVDGARRGAAGMVTRGSQNERNLLLIRLPA